MCIIFQKTYSPAVIQHAARYVQELCNSLSDTSGKQSPGNVIYKRDIAQRFSRWRNKGFKFTGKS